MYFASDQTITDLLSTSRLQIPLSEHKAGTPSASRRRGDLDRLLLKADFTDLNYWGDVGVVGDVALKDIGIGEEGVSECLDGVAGESANGSKGRRLVGVSAEHSDFDGDSLDGGAEQAECEGHVGVEVIVHVEVAARLSGVEDGDFDHASTIRRQGEREVGGAGCASAIIPPAGLDN